MFPDAMQELAAQFDGAFRRQQAEIDTQRAKLAVRSKPPRPLDSGRMPIEQSPLFGGLPNLFEGLE